MQFLTATFTGHGVQLGYSWPPILAGFSGAINVAVAFPDAKGSWFISDLLSAFLFSLTNRFHQFHVIIRILYYTFALLLAPFARMMLEVTVCDMRLAWRPTSSCTCSRSSFMPWAGTAYRLLRVRR